MRVPFVPAIAVIGLLQMCAMVAAILSMVAFMEDPDCLPEEAFHDETIFIRRWWILLLCIPVVRATSAAWDFEGNSGPMIPLY